MSQPPVPGTPNPEQPSTGDSSTGDPWSASPAAPPPLPEQPWTASDPIFGQPSPPSPFGQPSPQPSPFGQPYPQQPPFGQSSAEPPPFGQPWSAQPSVGEPGAGAPVPPYDPTQPMYGMPPTGYGPPAYPGAPTGYPVPPRKKSKALTIVLISLGVVVLLCCGGGALVYKFFDAGAKQVASTGADPWATPSDTDEPTAEPTDEASSETITVVEPKTLNGRPKQTSQQFKSLTKSLDASHPESSTASVSAVYGTVKKRDLVMVSAAATEVPDPETEIDGLFAGAGIGGAEITGLTSVPTGALGGEAKCGKASTDKIKTVICGWVDDGSVGMVIFFNESFAKAKGEFPKMREQIEKKSS